jgi:hypothetical protein
MAKQSSSEIADATANNRQRIMDHSTGIAEEAADVAVDQCPTG